MRFFVLLAIIFANQVFSLPNRATESPINGKHDALRVCNNKILFLLTKLNCILLITFHIQCHTIFPIEKNKLFEAMNDCGIGHLYPHFRDNQISRDNLWHVTEEQMEKMKITINDQSTYQRKKEECKTKGTKFITLLDYWLILNVSHFMASNLFSYRM